jgi:type II restriction/modification system DNA methylase subunit YeeA
MLNPETLKILDPACGSGHILVEAYDILKAIYLDCGYRQRDIPKLILENNLYGLDIDDRAAQLAGFALMMKAREDDRRIFSRDIKLNVLAIQASDGLEVRDEWLVGSDEYDTEGLNLVLRDLVALFADAKTLGSLIRVPDHIAPYLPSVQRVLTQLTESGDLFVQQTALSFLPLVDQALILAQRYDAVVANPPYMGGKGMNAALKEFAKKQFPDSKSDLFAMFIDRSNKFGAPHAKLAFVTPYVWMFISSYEKLREKLVTETTISTLIQLEYNAFEPACIPVCTFTFNNSHINNFIGSYIKLSDFKGHQNQAPKTLEAIKNPNCGWFYHAKPDDFKKIPGSPVAYWVSDKVRDIFENETISNKLLVLAGLTTGNTEKYLRYWHEISYSYLKFENTRVNVYKNISYIPYNKGGDFRRWYGNKDYVLKYSQHSFSEMEKEKGYRPDGLNKFFNESITWSKITSGKFSIRFSFNDSGFDATSTSAFGNPDDLQFCCLLLNSPVGNYLLNILNSSLTYLPRDIKNFPICETEKPANFSKLLNVSKTDWDSYETSWDFTENSLIRQKQPTLKAAFEQWQTQNQAAFTEMQRLEEENNRLFIEAYGLQDELTPEVPEDQISLTRADREKDAQRLISYAIGCMMGRYSLDEPGLIYAHAENRDFNPERYRTFPADRDGILPISGEGWFKDDACQRLNEFLQAVWGASTLEADKTWLADSLGRKPRETADQTLNRYLSTQFYKDHLQTYKKRPIYWLFSSGKQKAFECLVYLHRYNESTLARMRTEYVTPLLGKYSAYIEQLNKQIADAASTTEANRLKKEQQALEKKQTELRQFDDKLKHYADMRIKLDLDDGVKVNYGKFGDLLAEVKAVTGGSGE